MPFRQTVNTKTKKPVSLKLSLWVFLFYFVGEQNSYQSKSPCVLMLKIYPAVEQRGEKRNHFVNTLPPIGCLYYKAILADWEREKYWLTVCQIRKTLVRVSMSVCHSTQLLFLLTPSCRLRRLVNYNCEVSHFWQSLIYDKGTLIFISLQHNCRQIECPITMDHRLNKAWTYTQWHY